MTSTRKGSEPVTNWNDERRVAMDAAMEAAEAILRIREGGFDVASKGADGPVTTADLEANRILKERLLGRFPEDGWLSEETVDDARRLDCPRVWIVDPLDGTKEFVKGIPEFCVSVALAAEGRPVVGVVVNPSTGVCYSAAEGQGARADDSPISVRADAGASLVVAASRSEIGRGEWESYEGRLTVQPAGSAAFKLALVATGEVDASFTTATRNEWDIAAGVLLVHEAGGVTRDLAGNPYRFNQADPRKRGVFASSAAARDRAVAFFEEGRR